MQGSKAVEASTGLWKRLAGAGPRASVDVGCGDGRFPYECARGDPDRLYIGIDPDADTLREYAYRASRKPSRGGIANVLYIVASVDDLPTELVGLGEHLSVNFPWGGLLRGLLSPDAGTLARIASLARPDATFELVLTFDQEHDAAVFGVAPAPLLDEAYIERVLTPAFAHAGIIVASTRRLSREEGLAIPSTWGRRLLHGRPRTVFKIEGRITQAGL